MSVCLPPLPPPLPPPPDSFLLLSFLHLCSTPPWFFLSLLTVWGFSVSDTVKLSHWHWGVSKMSFINTNTVCEHMKLLFEESLLTEIKQALANWDYNSQNSVLTLRFDVRCYENRIPQKASRWAQEPETVSVWVLVKLQSPHDTDWDDLQSTFMEKSQCDLSSCVAASCVPETDQRQCRCLNLTSVAASLVCLRVKLKLPPSESSADLFVILLTNQHRWNHLPPEHGFIN